MRLEVDLDRCDAHGECMMAAPEVFELDNADLLHYRTEPPAELLAKVEKAARLCPTQAIRIVA